MDYKTTLIKITAILRKWNPVSLLVLFSFLLLSAVQTQAQTLKTDSSVPVLDVCAEYQQFTVRIAKGSQPCPNGELKIELPNGFELLANSVMVDGTPATVTNQTGQEVTVNVNIPAGPPSEEIEITFKAKALCGIIGSSAGDPMVTYTLSGCTGGTLTGTSETINIRYAVLRVNVTPDPIVGNLNDQPERTITIRNQGNGEISEFTLDRTLGGGLSHVSYDYSALTAAGWTVTPTGTDRLVFSGKTLQSGESITLKEKVQIDSCALTATNYEVYYGCTAKCTASGVNGTATHIVNLAVSGAPSLSVTQTSRDITCFNAYGTNTWTVTNTGSVPTEAITFEIITQSGINPSSITVGGTSAVVVSSTATTATITIPALAAGVSRTIVFEQYYPAPNGSAANCASAPTYFSNGQNAFSASYGYLNACAPVISAGTVSGETSYNYAGMHIGEVDIIGGTTFQADHLYTNFNIPSAGLKTGDKFVITVELSPELAASGISFGNAVVSGTNPYELTFTYDSPNWTAGTDLDFSFNRLQFGITLDCSTSPDLSNLWYRVGGELRKMNGGSSCPSVVFKCTETKLNGFCPEGLCDDGLINGTAGVNRVSLGYEVSGTGVPTISMLSSNADVRTFITGDILEIYQNNTVRLTTDTSNRVRLVVEKDPSANATLRTASGKVIVNGTTIISNATVTETASTYVLNYTLPTPLANADQVRLSIEIKAGSSSTGLKQFPAKSYLILDSNNEPERCGRPYTATGFYVTNGFSFTGGTKSFVDCEEDTNTATFAADVLGFRKQDAVFNNEYRKLFVPTTAVLHVSHYIRMTGVKVTVKNQPWITSPTTTISGLSINNANYNLDLSAALKTITGSSLGGSANGIDYLDEGFELEITPIVTISECEPVTSAANQSISVQLNGNIVDGEGVTTPYSQTQNLNYNTGIGSLSIATANGSNLGTLSADGSQVSWTIRVASTGSRNFNSVWFAKRAGLNILSVTEVGGGTLTANGNGIYQLGNFAPNSSKSYIITAQVNGCSTPGTFTLASGYSCTINSYPANINSGCRLADRVLTHKTLTTILQSEIFDQFNGVAAKPDLCNEIWYTVQLHNGGDTKLDNLKITIPLNTALGLVYNNNFEYTDAFTGNTPGAFSNTTGTAVVNGNNELVITLDPAVSLNTVERLRIKVHFKVDNCNFRSGAKHTVTPAAQNSCGSAVTIGNTTIATTKRIIIAGGSDYFPEIREQGTTAVVLDPVLTTGGVLRAVYNAEIINSGDFGVNDAITSQYRVSLKLPADWSIVGNPAAYLLPTGKVSYIGIDPNPDPVANRGYLYQVTSNINVGETLKFDNVPLKYTGTDITALSCDYDFGDIKLTVFQNIPVSNCVPEPTCAASGIDQVLYENIIPMELPVDTLLTIDPEDQYPVICNPSLNGGTPTLADIELDSNTKAYHLDWYENLQEANADLPTDRLPLSTPLVDGRTYYVINRFIVNGVCKSNIGTILVTFKDNNLSGTVTTICSPDNQTYRVQVTLTGTAPFVVDNTSTGYPGSFAGNVWTSAAIPATTPFGAGTPYNVTFTDANNCTPLNVTGVAPMCCTLEITCPPAITVNCGESLLPARTGQPTVVTACGNTTYTYTDTALSACTANLRTFTRTFKVTDGQGNTQTCTQTIRVRDNVAPVFNGALPANITLKCASAVPAAATLTATDNCGNAVVTFAEVTTAGSCANNFTVTRTWTATDGCGNTATHTQTITVNDNEKPTFVGALPAATVNVSCASAVPAAATLTATDNCGTATVALVEVTTAGSCVNNFTVTRTWTATDGCGNTATHTQVITVNDDVAPVISTPAQSLDRTLECSDAAGLMAALALAPMATDNCGGVTLNLASDTTTPAAGCANDYTRVRTWNFTDACGNVSADYVQTITVLDTTKPTIATVSGALNRTLECSDAAGLTAALALAPVASDNCTSAGDLTTTLVSDVTTPAVGCANGYTRVRTWTFTDECGNISENYVQTITVVDTTAPVIATKPNPVPSFTECGGATAAADYNAWLADNGGLDATDNCGAVTWSYEIEDTNTTCGNASTVIVNFKATDACGNTSVRQAAFEYRDTTAPTVNTANLADLSLNCSSTSQDELNAWLSNHGGATATDLCGTVTWTNDYQGGALTCGRTTTVTFTATDSCGNSDTVTADIIFTDNTAPVFNGALPANITLKCASAVPAAATLTATDNCGNAVVTFAEVTTAGSCANNFTVTRTWTATDGCGNTATHTQTITVNDDEKPTFVGALPAATVNVSCASAVPAAATLTATDNCGTATVALVETTTAGTCANNFTVTRVWTATDACGNTETYTQVITVNDDVAPVILTPAQNKTVDCGVSAAELTSWLTNNGGATATDNCGAVTWTNDYNIANFVSTCGSAGSVTVVFTATDVCGNASTTTATFTVTDTVAPVFVEVLPATEISVSCDNIPPAVTLTATDNCGTASVSFNETKVDGLCANSYDLVRVWTATDECGNTTTHTQTIKVTDTTKPVFVEALPANITYSCSSEVPAAVTLTATDNCGTATVSFNETRIDGSCANSYVLTRTWIATDICGNSTTHSQTITVEDKTKPLFVEALPVNATYSCSSEVPSAVTLTATDNCGTATVTFNETRVSGSCANAYVLTRTWTAADSCGNTTVHTQTITVDDKIKPVFTVEPQNKIVECDGLGNLDGPEGFNAWLASNAGAIATDNCGAVTISYLIEDTNTICGGAGTIIVDFIAKDECGNFTVKQAVYMILDRTPPVVTPAADLVIQCSINGEDELNAWLSNNGGATATDSCGLITWKHNYQSSLAICGAPILVTFTATDSCGNASTTQASVSVVDTVVPVLTKQAQGLTVQCGTNTTQALNNWLANHAGAEASDSCSTVTWTNNYNAANFAASCGATGSVEVIFKGSDACGNVVTTTATFTIEDTTAPTLVKAAQPKTVECDGSGNTTELQAWLANHGGATATDKCAGSLTWTNDYNAANFTALCGGTGSVTVTFTASDACGNSVSTVSTFTIADTTKPVFTTEPQNEVVECDGSGNTAAYNAWLANHGGGIATDNCGAVTYTYSVVDTAVLCGKTSKTTVKFTATDACGNKVNKQAVFTIEDTTAPIITVQSAALTIQCGNDVSGQITTWLNNHGGATATEGCGTVSWTHNYNGLTAACGTTGSALVTFTATDSCGNASTTQASVSVVDTVVPVLTKQAQGLTVQCGTNTTQALNNWLANHAGAEATDSCSTVTWTNNYNAANFVAACGATGSVEVIFTGSDACGNIVTTTATFTIEDITAPTLVKAAQNKTVECDGSGNTTELQAWLASNAGATATDTCDASLIWTNDYNPANFAALCGATGSVTVTFTATDACGNSVSTIATFTIVDTTKPVFTTEPQNEVVECDGSGNTAAYNAWLASYGNSTATDNCGTVTYAYSIVDTAILCGKTNKTTVKFTATDACGNKVVKQATFTIEDTTAPVITLEPSALTIECGNDASNQINTWLNNHGGATSADDCGTVTWSHNYKGLTAACGNTGSALVTFTATDSCGNASTTQASVSVVDTVVPVLTKQAQGLTVQCGTNTTQALNNWLANHAGAEASDSCSTVTWTNNYNAANFVAACGATGSVEVIFTGSDSCGNVVKTTATFTIEDTTAPTLVKAAQQKTVECDGSGNTTELQAWLANHGGATATDTCAGSLTWTNDYNATNFTALCGGTGSVTVTFTATDACGNSVSTVSTFTIVDSTKPVFTTEPQNEVVECDGSGNTSAYNAWLANHGGGVATDNCGAVTYTYSVVDTAVLCGKTSKTTIKFTATDSCGNKVNKQAVFTIQDTTAPVITVPSAALAIECGNDVSGQITTWLNNHGGATATDGCGTVSWTHNYNGLTAACGTTGSALVTFTATDSCGNASTTQASVSVVDTVVPVLTKQAQGLTVHCGTNTTQALNNWLANHAGAEASDSCSTVTWTNNYNTANFVAACGATGSVEVIFTGSDACGNVVTTTATFTIEDTIAPTLVKAAQPKTVECDGSGNTTELQAWLANHGGATATDTCDANLTWTNDYDANNFAALCGGTGSVTVTFTASDACGNSVSTVSTFTIADTTKPVFTTEPQNEVVECDGSGNTAAYNAWLASYGNSTATDNCGAVTYTYSVVDTAVLCEKTSKTTVKFTATDACGNHISKQATFTIQDTTAPNFITEAEDLVVECDGTGNSSDLSAWLNSRAGATAKDSCSNGLTWTNNFTGLSKDCGQTGSATVIFTATDACGNTSETTATFTIVDTTAPVFNVNLPQDRTIECSDQMPEVETLTADDLCSKVTVAFTEKRIDGNCPNNYEVVRTWVATDACGNTTEHVQTIKVQDTTAPEFVSELPAKELFIKCEDLKDAEVLKATDNCGAATVTVSDEVVPSECGDTKYTILRTWTATDDCGNETSYTQTIHLACKIEVFNAVTPNGDGYNDELVLKGIECYPGNKVDIYNRWGVLVYETKNYNSNGNTFKGYANGRVTVNKDSMLPTGTYYYVIKYDYDLGNGQVYPIEQAGYLHLETTK